MFQAVAVFFSGINISPGIVATRLRRGGIFYNRFVKSDGERNLKIGQHLAKLEAKI